MARLSLNDLHDQLAGTDNLLLVQDLDGVCMPLVRDPLQRRLDAGYIQAAARLGPCFQVLTNGEHGGRRGVNRLVEQALGPAVDPAAAQLYLPGLAAGGVQLQDRRGKLCHPGVSEAELTFLAEVPLQLEQGLQACLARLMPALGPAERQELSQQAVLDNQVSPTLNLNGLFARIGDDQRRLRSLQEQALQILETLLEQAGARGLGQSFFLHLAPNLGSRNGQEQLKPAAAGQHGSTDFQFMLRGAVKEAGLLVLINRHIARRTGRAPLGDGFNVRTAPRDAAGLLALCRAHIPAEQMPLLVGVGDTITSEPAADGDGWQRGGSDRGFLTLVQELGRHYDRANRVVLVDSSGGEVHRPNQADPQLRGLSDPEDPLQLDVLVPGGPQAYVAWFEQLASGLTDRG